MSVSIFRRLFIVVALALCALSAQASGQDFSKFLRMVANDFGKSLHDKSLTLTCAGKAVERKIEFVNQECVYHEIKGLLAYIDSNVTDLDAGTTPFNSDSCATKIAGAFRAHHRGDNTFIEERLNSATAICGSFNLDNLRGVLMGVEPLASAS